MAANCSSNCTSPDMEDSGVTGPMVTGIFMGFFFFSVISLSVCYAKKWCCFVVRYSGMALHPITLKLKVDFNN